MKIKTSMRIKRKKIKFSRKKIKVKRYRFKVFNHKISFLKNYKKNIWIIVVKKINSMKNFWLKFKIKYNLRLQYILKAGHNIPL